jgi:CDP-glucose 4,6-dehydratase
MMDEIRTAFDGKTVFVTGHNGFKGAWVCLWLKSLGAKVFGYSLEPPTSPSNFEVCRVDRVIDGQFRGDIRDWNVIRDSMLSVEPDFVLHMAAQTVVKTGYQSPRETFDVNVTGTASVLDAVADLQRPCTVVCVTSDKCYANDDRPRVFVETDPMGERDPYGASKGCTELVVNAYTHSYFHPDHYDTHQVGIASARAGNVIGGGDWTPHALIPDLVKAALNGGSVELRNPNATRPWQHVLQTLSGYLLLATKLQADPRSYSGGWNFGPDERDVLSVSQFSQLFFDSWGQGSWINDSLDDQHPEAQLLQLSIQKARDHLSWVPTWDTRTTVERTVEWFKQSKEGRDPRSVCLEQIDQFQEDWNTASLSVFP